MGIFKKFKKNPDVHELAKQTNILYVRGDLDGTMTLLKEQERIRRELGDKAELPALLNNQALILQNRRDLSGAMALYKEGERICLKLGNNHGLALSLINQAVILAIWGKSLTDVLPLSNLAYRLAVENGYAALAKHIEEGWTGPEWLHLE